MKTRELTKLTGCFTDGECVQFTSLEVCQNVSVPEACAFAPLGIRASNKDEALWLLLPRRSADWLCRRLAEDLGLRVVAKKPPSEGENT